METPDSLFSGPPTPSAATTGSPAPEDGPPPSTSSKPMAAPAFVPRAVGKRRAPAAKSTSAATLASQSIGASKPAVSSSGSSLPTSRPIPTASTSTPSDARPPKLSREEQDRLEAILCAVEAALSDWGMSAHRADGVLDKFREAKEAGREGLIHVSQILTFPPVRALSNTLMDVQRAVKLRDSHIIKVDDSGFQVGRKEQPDVDRLAAMEPADWDEMIIYLENIPLTLANTNDRSASLFLSSALATPVQRLLLPPLFDPNDPPDLNEDTDVQTQEQAFAQARAAAAGNLKKPPRPLPKSGGPFKGFAFAVLRSEEEVERVLREFPWDRKGGGRTEDADGDEANDEKEGEEDEAMVNGDPEKAEDAAEAAPKQYKKKGKKEKLSPTEIARRSGTRALSYTRWLELKKEYLAYRRTLETLLEAQASGELSQLRYPRAPRDIPPHLQQSREPNRPDPPSRPQGPSPAGSRGTKRAPSPPSSSFDTPSNYTKRSKRASSPSAVRTPSPSLDLESDAALDIEGAYPEGVVLWIRNVHEKSNKNSLKALFGGLLEQLQEGSGKGIEFVDFEKGLDTCHVRCSNAQLASLLHDHLVSLPSLHLSPQVLTPVGTLSPKSLAAAENDSRRPLMSELLNGERERRYWSNVPESTRRNARKAAGGRVGLLKEPKDRVGAGTTGKRRNGDEEDGRTGGGQPKKRKRPSRL
ncbi:hypothetical protein NBRC10512_006014 [Rhodotorula toruloides]|uniref:RHTO0S20e01618g1_1 n=2 Tax=Rhodotorula toruloides TaxID=5286 RepID=A0A061BLF3_RHOTO|nr:uncharacterized protein RHTO_04316 [Rhodotorula toruloides NP11]EMS19542.1 hypothetical protein RHTO_04316 [Rhodotorula toruloides NP11]CDR48798.1 RHTO0S20e01618g1_1 [Rhodotorula toruloides]